MESIKQKEILFSEIVATHPCDVGKDLSKTEREGNGESGVRSLTYGEVEFITMADCFKAIDETYGGMPATGKFIDLGSGTGKG